MKRRSLLKALVQSTASLAFVGAVTTLQPVARAFKKDNGLENQWVTLLDSRTALGPHKENPAGYQYYGGVRGPGRYHDMSPPFHPNCRCVVAPIIS